MFWRKSAATLTPEIRDRALGSFIGLAIGDALGTTLEFCTRDSRPLHTEMIGGGHHRLKPGQWTDDTSMAICLARSLASNPKLDPSDLMTRFANWRDEGEESCTGRCFDIGRTTTASISSFLNDGNPIAGLTSHDTAGNGSIMRLAPAVLRHIGDENSAAETARLQSATTHGAPACIEACDLLARLLHRAITGKRKGFAEISFKRLAPKHPDIRAIASKEWRLKSRDAIASSGYVASTLEAAIWAVDTTTSFEDALVLAVNLGNDADTVGAVAGQIAGAVHGLSSIPDRWLEPLAWRDQLIDLGNQVIEIAATTPRFKPFWS
jgi:ADP-ribosyl-[dinitrogen reductase] hydrolase